MVDYKAPIGANVHPPIKWGERITYAMIGVGLAVSVIGAFLWVSHRGSSEASDAMQAVRGLVWVRDGGIILLVGLHAFAVRKP